MRAYLLDDEGDEEVLVARAQGPLPAPDTSMSEWRSRRATAEFISRRAIETLLIFWIGRDPERRTRFEERVRFEAFTQAVQVMRLTKEEIEQWKRTLTTRQRRAKLEHGESPSLEGAWEIAHRHWRREPLLANHRLLVSLRDAIDGVRHLVEHEADATRPLVYGPGDARDLWNVPAVACGFRALSEELRRKDPTMPRLVDRSTRPTPVGWKVLAEVRFLLLGDADFGRATQAA